MWGTNPPLSTEFAQNSNIKRLVLALGVSTWCLRWMLALGVSTCVECLRFMLMALLALAQELERTLYNVAALVHQAEVLIAIPEVVGNGGFERKL